MNWVIKDSDKFKFHTHLSDILKPVYELIKDYNWFLTDLEYVTSNWEQVPINLEQRYFILSADDFGKLLLSDTQIIWGVVLGFPKNVPILFNEADLHYVEGNDKISMNGNLQLENAAIEINCFDSSFTIVKFTDENMSRTFKDYFPEAIELEKF